MNPKLKQECATCTSEVAVPELPVALQQYRPGRPSLAIPSCLRSWGLHEAYMQAHLNPQERNTFTFTIVCSEKMLQHRGN